MDEDIETLLVEVRANTAGFRSDIETMRGSVDSTLTDGFAKAGDVLERGLLGAVRRGSLGFAELKQVALRTVNEIAAQALQSGIGSLFSGPASTAGGATAKGSLLTGAIGALFGLPGRATGGPVSPGSAYLVGERGPEVFVPTSSGRVEAGGKAETRDVRVAIHISGSAGADAPAALQRSSRQVASSVRRALQTL